MREAKPRKATTPWQCKLSLCTAALNRYKHRVPHILHIQNLRVQRGGIRILRGLDWLVERGQHWAVLGPNGSGKTSLLAALTGYLTPTAGEIQLLGRTYGRAHWPQLRRKIGLVSSALHKLMADDEPAVETVASGKTASINLWHRPGPAMRRTALGILRRLECAHLAARPWAHLSQGERQRVLIGRALMARPQLLILDEPCAGLDPCAREHFLQFLQHLGSSRGTPALVLVTHHVEEIMPAFTHALLLRGGLATACGPVSATLKSATLSTAFGHHVRLKKVRGRYTLHVPAVPRRVM
ncbi:MAG: ATP-binding cassette domain-containing protein [Pedosphaera sp.]|nr:ATP-binding cassette domain-containing protein [Pedosphaera sp.]